MITLKWSVNTASSAIAYKIYKSFIGFDVNKISLPQKTLVLSIDGAQEICIVFDEGDVAEKLKTIPGLFVTQLYDQWRVKAKKSIKIISGTSLTALKLSKGLIEEKSLKLLVATVYRVDMNRSEYEFKDEFGAYDDFYGISSIYQNGTESNMCPMRQGVSSTGPICVVEGLVSDVQGSRVQDIEVIAKIHRYPDLLNKTLITKAPIKVYTHSDGKYTLPLLQGAIVKIEIPSLGLGRTIEVPKATSAQLADLDEWEDDL